MPLARRRARLVLGGLGGLGAALLMALPVLASRTEAPAADRTALTPAALSVAKATVARAPRPAAAPAAAAAAKRVRAVAARSTPGVARGQSGMLIFLDPETGQLVPMPPTARELESIAPPLSRTADENLQMINLGRNGTGVVLDESFHDYSIVRLDASGQLRMDCLQGPEVAKALRTAPAPAMVEK